MQFDPYPLDLGRDPNRHFAPVFGTDRAVDCSDLRWTDAFFLRGSSEITMERAA
jgi:hypothetical protein